MRSNLTSKTNINLKKEREIHMKHMKKIASFVLAAIMVLAMVVPTFADPTTYAITINTIFTKD